MHPTFLFVRGGIFDHRLIQNGRFGSIIDDHTPRSIEEAADAIDTRHAPRLGGFEGAHEHFIKTQRVGAVLLHHIVRVDHVAPAF